MTSPRRDRLYDEISALLAGQPPQSGQELLAKVERLERFEQAVRDALKPGRWRGFNGPDGVSKDEVIGDIAIALLALDRRVAQPESETR